MSYKVSGKDWADIFFKLDPSDVSKSKYMCILCPVGSQLYTSAKGHGYTNLKTHITVKHSESITDMVNEFRGIKNNNTLDNYSNNVQWPDEMDDSDEDEYIDPALINVTLDSDNE